MPPGANEKLGGHDRPRFWNAPCLKQRAVPAKHWCGAVVPRLNGNERQETDMANEKSKTNGNGHFYRFHLPHVHLTSVFGDDWFAQQAEGFARFFGTPVFLILQTVIVILWMLVNIIGWTKFDQYPFILLNLAFSLQAAYAAPLILLAQTRQADRDKALTEADARHREDLASASQERQDLAAKQAALLMEMLRQNTELTQSVKVLAERLELLTGELRDHIGIEGAGQPGTK
jgi:uncharacterized membrane protein